MTPAARVQAAIEVLDIILDGAAAEQALSRWARGHRFAGSKDRAALRDLVFDALRRRASYAARGGGLSGRGLMIGQKLCEGADIDAMFAGQGYGPAPLSASEHAAVASPKDLSPADACDMPAWIMDRLAQDHGPRAAEIATALRDRAPVDLRVNIRRTDRDEAQHALAAQGILAQPVPGVATALRVVEGARKVSRSDAYLAGLVELQDAASQASVLESPVPHEGAILDFCAGGGGKALALAAGTDADVYVHDVSAKRMQDIPARAARAGVRLPIWNGDPATFDMVFCDAPCSGSGTWRRAPEAKWALTEAGLAQYRAAQRTVLSEAAACVAPGGLLVYATCSVLAEENSAQVTWFLDANPGFTCAHRAQRVPNAPGDGFFHAVLKKILP